MLEISEFLFFLILFSLKINLKNIFYILIIIKILKKLKTQLLKIKNLNLLILININLKKELEKVHLVKYSNIILQKIKNM